MTKITIRQIFSALFDKKYIFGLVLTFVLGNSASLLASSKCPAQGPRLTAVEYCRLYAAEAQRQMLRYGIPASITLAQGMYESGYGSSYIAVKGNNHFGIKAYRGWSGAVVRCDDDSNNEPFCKFSSVLEGYEYHSKFLRDNTRYAPLFKLGSTDYKGWARGLQKCGYATSSTYPERLIDIIERYQLHTYDTNVVLAESTETSSRRSGKQSSYVSNASSHKLYTTAAKRGIKYVRAKKGDDLVDIGREFNLSTLRLRTWNDMPRDYQLREGDIVYLGPKHRRTSRQYPTHTVAAGESLHSICQKYGVRLSCVMKRNNMTSGTVQQGQVLKLR